MLRFASLQGKAYDTRLIDRLELKEGTPMPETPTAVPMKPAPQTRQRLGRLFELLEKKKSLLIVMQDNPDPDSIAAAVALRFLANARAKVACSIAHGGTVGRGENRALVRYLGLNLRLFSQIDLAKFDRIALVDTQPGTGNNSLPPEILPDIVIDHHPCRNLTRKTPLSDVRNRYGAVSTILLEYLIEADLHPEPPLATALLYGIRSDTQDLGMEAAKPDMDAIHVLFPLANKRMLSEIQRGRVSREYYQMLANALKNARVYTHAVITNLGPIPNPDMIAEVADLLLRDDEIDWALAYGLYEGRLLLSIRTSQADAHAEQVIRRMVARRGTGGGHASRAGGQIPLPDPSKSALAKLEKQLRSKFLKALNIDDRPPQKLIQI